MKRIMLLLAVFGLFFSISETSAQTSRKTAPTQNRALKVVEKPQLNGKANLNRNGQGRVQAEMLNEKPGENERVFTIYGYKLQFPANQQIAGERTLAVVYLYGKPDQLFGKASFYGNGSQSISSKVTMDKSETVQMAYHIDQLPHILSFLDAASKMVLVYNEKERSAYLSSGVIPMNR